MLISNGVHKEEIKDKGINNVAKQYESIVNYIQSDFLSLKLDKKFDALFAIRCFEYFDDKDKALELMSSLIEDDGHIIITTKNSNHVGSVRNKRLLHSGQVSFNEMKKKIEDQDLKLVKVYPTTIRLKSKYLLLRALFWVIFRIGLILGTRTMDFATESYTYVIKKKK